MFLPLKCNVGNEAFILMLLKDLKDMLLVYINILSAAMKQMLVFMLQNWCLVLKPSVFHLGCCMMFLNCQCLKHVGLLWTKIVTVFLKIWERSYKVILKNKYVTQTLSTADKLSTELN